MLNKALWQVFFVFFTLNSYSQDREPMDFDFYSVLDLNAGNYIGYDFALTTIFQKTVSIKAGISRSSRKPEEIPPEFLPYYDAFNVINPNYNAKQYLSSYDLLLGGVINFKKRKYVRIQISAGIGIVTISKPTSWEKKTNPAKLGYQYDFRMQNIQSGHFIFNPRIDFPFTNIYGLSISPILKIGPKSSFFGIGLGHMFGKIR